MALRACNIALMVIVAVCFVVATVVLMHRFGGRRRAQRAAQLLFPISQLLVVELLVACCLVYELPLFESVLFTCLGICCLPIDARLFRALDRSFDAEAEELRAGLLSEQLAVQQACQARARAEAAEAARVRRSMIDQLRAADAQLDERSAAGATRNLEQAVELAGTRALRLCQNHAIDALLQVKSHAASEAGIAFDVAADVPIDLNLPEVEVCGVLANLVDNAMNATRELDEGKRLVKVSACVRANFLVISVRNSCAAQACEAKGAKVPASASARESAEPSLSVRHGWGQGIVRSVAERHGGTFKVSADDEGLYVATVIMTIDGDGGR